MTQIPGIPKGNQQHDSAKKRGIIYEGFGDRGIGFYWWLVVP